MLAIEKLESAINNSSKKWLITGVAGFIGSNLLERLLKLNQTVVGMDNLSEGSEENIQGVLSQVSDEQARRFHFIEGDIRDLETCMEASKEVDIILHQAALGSVPRSIKSPTLSSEVNIQGAMNVFTAAVEHKISRVVYASSSSVYGDSPVLPKVEEKVGNILSPYALTKSVNEQMADVFHRCYGIDFIGLRYFNVFGRRQSFTSAYAAVMPTWVSSLIKGESVYINGDGETSRDFCYIDNVVDMNLLSALTNNSEALNKAYNVAVGEQTTLNELYAMMTKHFGKQNVKPIYRDFRKGDIKHSLADISRAKNLLGYVPRFTVRESLPNVLDWYAECIL